SRRGDYVSLSAPRPAAPATTRERVRCPNPRERSARPEPPCLTAACGNVSFLVRTRQSGDPIDLLDTPPLAGGDVRGPAQIVRVVSPSINRPDCLLIGLIRQSDGCRRR